MILDLCILVKATRNTSFSYYYYYYYPPDKRNLEFIILLVGVKYAFHRYW